MPTKGTAKAVTYNVFVKKTGDHFTATVVGFPNCTAEAPSRDAAIQRAREAVADFVSEGELVRIEVESTTAVRSLRDFAGMWADDDTFDEFVDAMKAYRKEVEATESAS